MSDSLQDQLLSLGLAKKKPARKPNQRKARRKGGGGAGKAGGTKTGDISLDAAWRARDQSEKQRQAEAKRRKLEEDRRRRELNAAIAKIVDEHMQNDPKAELKRNFTYKGRIRSVLVTPEQLERLNSGDLAVVFLKGGYFVVTPAVAEQVRSLSADHVPDLTSGSDDDDGEHPVPDDLVW